MPENDVLEAELAQFLELTASACHAANKQFCEDHGDYSQPDWENASEHQKQSAYKGVLNILENPDTTPEQSHKCWLQEKVKAGWIYGEVKDEACRMHPCIVPYDKLPEVQKAKDEIFIGVVHAMVALHWKN